MPVHQQDFPGSLRALAIVGPGLIGGSLALAAQRAGIPEVRVWCREASLGRVRRRLPQAASDLREVIEGADAVVLCTPAGALEGLGREIRGHLGVEAVVTDAASTKGKVCGVLDGLFGEQFAGSHPMAGSEQSGIEAADEALFEGSLCIIVPGRSADATRRVESLWQLVGCRTLRMEAGEHDRLLARASHLPHAVAAALALAVKTRCPEALAVAAGGYRDTTRVAAGAPGMWAEIFMDNREWLLAAIKEYEEAMDGLRQALENADFPVLEGLLTQAAMSRKEVQ